MGRSAGVQEAAPAECWSINLGVNSRHPLLGKGFKSTAGPKSKRHRVRCLILGATKTPPEQNCSLSESKALKPCQPHQDGAGSAQVLLDAAAGGRVKCDSQCKQKFMNEPSLSDTLLQLWKGSLLIFMRLQTFSYPRNLSPLPKTRAAGQ